jgi:hypothetical protein
VTATYKEFFLTCDLTPDLPVQVYATLRYMTRTEEETFEHAPMHELFEQQGWQDMLRSGERRAFAGVSRCELATRRDLGGMDTYTLSITYEGGDDDLMLFTMFAEWIAPYSSTVGWVGYFRAEHDLYPTLLYFKHGRVYLSHDEQKPLDMEDDRPW